MGNTTVKAIGEISLVFVKRYWSRDSCSRLWSCVLERSHEAANLSPSLSCRPSHTPCLSHTKAFNAAKSSTQASEVRNPSFPEDLYHLSVWPFYHSRIDR